MSHRNNFYSVSLDYNILENFEEIIPSNYINYTVPNPDLIPVWYNSTTGPMFFINPISGSNRLPAAPGCVGWTIYVLGGDLPNNGAPVTATIATHTVSPAPDGYNAFTFVGNNIPKLGGNHQYAFYFPPIAPTVSSRQPDKQGDYDVIKPTVANEAELAAAKAAELAALTAATKAATKAAELAAVKAAELAALTAAANETVPTLTPTLTATLTPTLTPPTSNSDILSQIKSNTFITDKLNSLGMKVPTEIIPGFSNNFLFIGIGIVILIILLKLLF